jgi:RNA polymerase sigma factor (sigma-70 family)
LGERMQLGETQVLEEPIILEEPQCDTGEFPVLTREQEVDIFRRYAESRDIRIREEIFHHNKGLVLKIARKYEGRGLDFDDLVQEGRIGVLYAIDAFSLARGNKFSTFAVMVINQTIIKALTRTGRWTRIPADILSLMRNMIEKEKEYKRIHGHFPDYDTLFSIMGFPPATFQTVFYARRVTTIASFDELIDRLIDGSEKRDDLQIEDIVDLVTDETRVGYSALLELQRLNAGVSQIQDLVRKHYSARDAELYLRFYGFHDFSFIREEIASLSSRYYLTKKQIDNIRVKCNNFVRQHIPNFVISDYSEERCLALRELAMMFE